MDSAENFTDAARASIERQLSARLTSAAKQAAFADKVIELAETLPLFRLSLSSLRSENISLEQAAAATGEWHIQIHHDGEPAEFAKSLKTGEGEEAWRLLGTFTSPLAKRIDEALEWAKENGANPAGARLLHIPSHHLYALWFKDLDRVVIASTLDQHSHQLQLQKLYGSKEFLVALKDTAVANLPPLPITQPRLGGEIKNNAWGILTFLMIAALAGCGYVIWHSGPDNLSSNGQAIIDLRTQWLAVEAAIVLGCATAGRLAYGRLDGILIDDCYRISLARFQWMAWTVVILGAYFTESVWNAAHGYAIPALSADMLKLLGIVSASPVVSNVIVDGKKNDRSAPPPTFATSRPGALPAPQPPPGQPAQVGSIDCNISPGEASFADLYLGEEVANRNVVDVSRLQKLIITILLVVTYVGMLWDSLGAVRFQVDAAQKVVAGTGSIMPALDSGFVWLIGISHAAYLAYKATPKTPSSAR